MGKYDALAQLLGSLPEDQHEVDLTFGRIDGLVDGLPPSARRLRNWWANNSQGQSLAWNRAGWHVRAVDLAGSRVVFARGQVGGTYASRRRSKAAPERADSPPVRQKFTSPQIEQAHPPVETVDARVVFEWDRLGSATLDSIGKIAFPDSIPAGPGLYRFTLSGPSGRSRVYIGESDNLRRRLSTNYRNPGPRQRTSLRINALLVEHLRAGSSVTVDLAVTAALHVPGSPNAVLDLSRKAGRLLAENAALVLAQLGGLSEIENLG